MNTPKTILISRDTLLRISIRALLNDAFGIVPDEYGAIEDCDPDCLSSCDLILIDAITYILNIDSFLPIRTKTMVVSDDEKTDDMIISRFSPESKIIDKLNSIIHKLEENNFNRNALSQREIEVLKLIVSGCINKEIADKLNISINTVLSHRKNITGKLGIKSVSGLSVYAMMNGYMSP